jgi:hypothetical protein
MAQVRAVMPARFVGLADELLEVTGVPDYSTLLGLLFSRYGQHLLSTWQIQACPHPIAMSAIEPVPTATPEPFSQMEF